MLPVQLHHLLGYRDTAQHVHSLSASNQWADFTATNATGEAMTALDHVLDDAPVSRAAAASALNNQFTR